MPQIAVAEAHELLDSFANFLTAAIHSILYHRGIYPPRTFIATRFLNLVAQQCRHPAVCTWVRDLTEAVRAQLANGTVKNIVLVVHSQPPTPKPGQPTDRATTSAASSDSKPAVLERWVFDVSYFPSWTPPTSQRPQAVKGGKAPAPATKGNGKATGRPPGKEAAAAARRSAQEVTPVNWADVDEGLRAGLLRLAYAAEKLAPVPPGCGLAVAVELRDDAERPIGHPQDWIPSEPNLQPPSRSNPVKGADVGGAATVPVRTVEAGPLFFECWVEEGHAKFNK